MTIPQTAIALLAIYTFLCVALGYWLRGRERLPVIDPNENGVNPL
jgi:hypothetical protein